VMNEPASLPAHVREAAATGETHAADAASRGIPA
jgi:hypothetical protein